MDLKELNYIVTIAEEGSISRAAEKLYMAQSSLSQALQIYEAGLGISLFMRTTRGVRPTPAGEAFLSHARQILKHYHLAQNEAWDIENLKGGQLVFGISTFRGTYLLPPVLKKFHARYPGIHVELKEMDSIDLENQIVEGLLDLALIAAPPVRLNENVEFLMKDEVMLVTTADHPVLAYAKPCKEHPEQAWIDLKDTASFEYILGAPSTVLGRLARDFIKKAGFTPLGQSTHISAPFAASMAREGLGLALTYQSCRVKGEGYRYLRIGEAGVFVDLALAYPSGEYRSKAASALAKLFHETYHGEEKKDC